MQENQQLITRAFLELPVLNLPGINFLDYEDLFPGSGLYLAKLPTGDTWIVSVYFEPNSIKGASGHFVLNYSDPISSAYLPPYINRDMYEVRIKELEVKLEAQRADYAVKESIKDAKIAELECKLEQRPTRNGTCEWVSGSTLVKIIETLASRPASSTTIDQ